MLKSKTTTVTTKTVVELDGQALTDAFAEHIPEGAKDVRFFVRVPGGGDWSNMDLDFDRDVKLTITWTEVEETNA